MTEEQETLFNVLNEWLDLPQHTFMLMWPELEEGVQPIKAAAWDEGRKSVGQDLAHPPLGSVKLHQVTKNPYRS